MASSTGEYDFRDDSGLCQEQLAALLRTEASYLPESFRCLKHNESAESAEGPPLEDWRSKIVQWSFRVIDHFQLDREVVTIGMSLFDRFLAHLNGNQTSLGYSPDCTCSICTGELTSKTYQLAAMTCMYTAMKCNSSTDADVKNLQSQGEIRNEDVYARRKVFKLKAFVELSRGQFTEHDVTRMELLVLHALEWKVHPPTAMTFVNHMMTFLPTQDITGPHVGCSYYLIKHVMRELSRYLTELAVCLGQLSTARPSQVALAALLVSMDLLTVQAMPHGARAFFVKEAAFYGLWADDPTIDHLKYTLHNALLPEMLFDEETSQLDSNEHPICLARELGILNLAQIYQGHQFPGPQRQIPPSPRSTISNRKEAGAWTGSPVSVRL